MSGAISLRPLYVFVVWTGKNLPLLFWHFVLGVDGSGGWVVLRIGLLM